MTWRSDCCRGKAMVVLQPEIGNRPALAARSFPPGVIFATGFRVFFLLAAMAAVALLPLWVGAYVFGLKIGTYYPAAIWHGHEMVFGYSAAVVAGFLLTAVPNWTGLPTARGGRLAALAAAWLAGRVLPLFPHSLPGCLIATVDLVFLPALGGVLLVPLLRAYKFHNMIFPVVLAVWTGANAAVHLDALGIAPGYARLGLRLAVDLVILIVAVIGGRVIPFFTARAVGSEPRRWAVVDNVAKGAILLLAVAKLLVFPAGIVAAIAFTGGVAHAVRLAGWYDRRVWRVPLLWVLHTGYAWVVAGFALEGLAAFGGVLPFVPLHAFTAGAIGVLTFGMMARVSLGHTGRPLAPARSVAVGFALVNAAAVVRVLVVQLTPDHAYVPLITAAGVLWTAAFAVFLIVYAPILVSPRPDGRPG